MYSFVAADVINVRKPEPIWANQICWLKLDTYLDQGSWFNFCSDSLVFIDIFGNQVSQINNEKRGGAETSFQVDLATFTYQHDFQQ